MTQLANSLTSVCLSALGQKPPDTDSLRFTGVGSLASRYPVTDLALACHATVGLSLVRLIDPAADQAITVSVDRRLASGWFQQTIKPVGWDVPGPWDSIAGDYRCRDGWIRLHTNAPLHRAAVQRVLGKHQEKSAMASAVQPWLADELETAVIDAGGCAARMRSAAQWATHPHGSVVNAEPLIHLEMHQDDGAGGTPSEPDPALPTSSPNSSARPLSGIKVLDLTRVLAGPVATRILAGFGAQVLRLDPLDWEEPGVVPDMTLGKRCARLDLRSREGRDTFIKLLSEADVLVHGYRAGALNGLGLDAAFRRSISPGLVDVSLNAYGWQGPWSARRGFDSLVQMSSGIAHAGMTWRGSDSPVPLPAQALDHATGYLMAASVLHGLACRRQTGEALTARLSLARTAALLMAQGQPEPDDEHEPYLESDYLAQTEHTTWGPAKRLKPALGITGLAMHWDSGATPLGAHPPAWWR